MKAGVADLLGPGGVIARRLPDYEVRQEQLALAEAVERALSLRRHLVAEAGTGVGKSFAYLLPAALHADAHQGEGPVVVSTRTIALQEQLEHKDLPFLHAVLPFEWSSVTAVGRNNYLCLRRMHLAERERHLLEQPDQHAELRRIVDWSLATHEGTRMDLPFEPAAEVWEEVQAEHGNCLQRACRHYDHCHWQRARRRLQTAQVLIVNHALYCADLALRMAGATFLPAHRVVVFDEAHHLERVATESLGLRLSASSIGWQLRRLHPRRSHHGLLARHGSQRARALLAELQQANAAFFAGLDDRLAGQRDGVVLAGEVLAEPLTPLLLPLAEELTACSGRAGELDVRMELQARAVSLAALAAIVQGLCDPAARPDAGLVRWLEPAPKGAVLRGAPLDVSATLRQHLFGGGVTAILTSATLGPADDEDFSWFRRQLGLTAEVDTLRIGSPFDFRRRVALSIEDDMPDPGAEPASFRAAVAERTVAHVLQNGGRALVLCTSWSLVQHLAEALERPLAEAGITLLIQGRAPLQRLLEQKRSDPTSVLVGTDSLWEGIDVRGDALTLVVVTRLPFSNPTHPLTRARLAAIESRGGDAFAEHSLPEAILRFRQGFGRLIRSRRDHGRVVVLDPRARSKPYGRRFLASLPECGDAQAPD